MGIRSYTGLRKLRTHDYIPHEGDLVAAIDTTTEAVGVAVARDRVVLASRRLVTGKPQGTSVLAMLEQVLADLGGALADLKGVVVTRGPGSFTGVRLGLMTAKSLAWSLDIPLVTVDTAEVLASQAKSPGTVAVAIDARKGEVYLALFEHRAEGLHCTMPVEVLAPASAAERISALAVPPTLVGTGFVAYPELSGLRTGKGLDLADFPDPGELLRIGLDRMEGLDPLTAEPLYVRRFEVTPPKPLEKTK